MLTSTPDCWVVKDSKDNADATASKSGATGVTYKLMGVCASFTTNPAAPKLLQVKDGTTVIWEGYVTNSAFFPLYGLVVTTGAAVSAVLAASGAGGNLGKVSLIGFNR